MVVVATKLDKVCGRSHVRHGYNGGFSLYGVEELYLRILMQWLKVQLELVFG